MDIQMANAPSYARFLNQISDLKKAAQDHDVEGCDEILAYLAVREAKGLAVNVTELVQSLKFGTGPTVHRKVSVLAERRFIKIAKSKTDARAKVLSLAAPGLNHLKERSRLMKRCLES